MRRAAEISLTFPKVVLITKTKAQGDCMNSTRSYKLVSGRTDDLSIHRIWQGKMAPLPSVSWILNHLHSSHWPHLFLPPW